MERVEKGDILRFDMKKFIRIRSLKDIRKYHASTCSCTWGSGRVIEKRGRELMSPSIQSKGDTRFVFYCTEKDWQRAFKLTGTQP